MQVLAKHAQVCHASGRALLQLVRVGTHGRGNRAQAGEHFVWRNHAFVGGIQDLLEYIAQVAELGLGQQDAHIGGRHVLFDQVAVADPGLEHRRRLGTVGLAQVGQLHGVADQCGILEHFLLGRVGLGIVCTADGRLAHVGRPHLLGDGGSQAVDLAAKGLHIASVHRVVQRGVGTRVIRQGTVLRFGGAVVLGAARGFQVQGVQGHARVAGFDLDLFGAKAGARQLVTPVNGAGIGDQHHIACAKLAPVDLVDGRHDTGVGIFVELAARHLGLLQVRDLGHEVGTVLHRVGVGVHLADVLQARHGLGAGTVGNQAELDLLAEVFLLDLPVHALDRLTGAIDVRVHRNGRVDDEHHGRTERLQLLVGSGLGRCRRCGCGTVGLADRRHIEDARAEAFLGHHFFAAEHGQQVEVFLQVDEVFGLFGQHAGRLGAVLELGA
ncbi:hypothetical protein D3C79_687080 [compost metagenome]